MIMERTWQLEKNSVAGDETLALTHKWNTWSFQSVKKLSLFFKGEGDVNWHAQIKGQNDADVKWITHYEFRLKTVNK
jgi:hypothetical protein